MAPRLPRITAFYLFIGDGDPIEIRVDVPDYTRRRRIREQRARQQQIHQQIQPTNPIQQVIGRPPLIFEDFENINEFEEEDQFQLIPLEDEEIARNVTAPHFDNPVQPNEELQNEFQMNAPQTQGNEPNFELNAHEDFQQPLNQQNADELRDQPSSDNDEWDQNIPHSPFDSTDYDDQYTF